MTIIFAAGTALVNPPGATPTLTLSQVWAGLELKRTYAPSHVLESVPYRPPPDTSPASRSSSSPS